jgi:hypothetical protein
MKESIKIYHIKSVTKATCQLTELGINTIENADRVNTPEKVQQPMDEFEEGTLVDYISKLDRKGFDVLWSIMLTEKSQIWQRGQSWLTGKVTHHSMTS